VLIDNGKSNAEIIVPKHASAVARLAAKELRSFLQQATGVAVSIRASRTGRVPAIFVGENEWTRAWGIDVARFPRDAFVIRRISDVIAIVGRDDPWINPRERISKGVGYVLYEQATLFGVYDFLERFLGIRFYFPGDVGTVVPKAERVVVPAMDIYEAPDFTHRKISYSHGKWFLAASPKTISRERGLNRCRWRGETRQVPNCHGLARVGYAYRMGATHPEYFSLLRGGVRNNDLSLNHSGHLCFSHPDVLSEICEDAAAYLTGKPHTYRDIRTATGRRAWDGSAARPGYFNVMPQDGLGETRWCRCATCRWYWDEGKQTELIWRYTAEIARRVQKAGIPGYITNMAYGLAREIPEIDIPGNVLVMLALQGPWKEKFPDRQQEDDRLIRDWNAKLKPRKVWLWNYAIQAGGRYPEGLPPLSTRLYASYYKRLAPHILGAYVESEVDWFLSNYLNWYVYHRVAWDASTDVEALLAEHHQKLFGSGAPPMGRFFDKVEELFVNDCLPESKDTPLGPVEAKRNAREIWEDVFSEAVFAEFDRLYDEAESLAKDEPNALRRVRWFREHFLGFMKRGREKYASRKREIEDLVLDVPRLRQSEAITLDGQLDEEAWQRGTAVGLVPLASDRDPVVKTRVRALWDAQYLYIGYECEEPRVSDMKLAVTKRDEASIWEDASVEIFLDPTASRKTYYQFMVSAKDIVTDGAWTVLGQRRRDRDWVWNAKVAVKTRIGNQGYVMELAIPIRDLAPGGVKEGTMWVANLCRNRNVRGVSKEENACQTWSPFLERGYHNIERFGRIRFVETAPVSPVIGNGSFERLDRRGHPTPWHFSIKPGDPGPDRIRLDTSTFRDGVRSLCIESRTGKTALVAQYLPKLEPNTKYLLTFFLKADRVEPMPGSRLSGLFANVWAARQFNRFMPRNGYRGTFGWTKQGIELTSPPDAGKEHTCYIRLSLREAKGTVWLDDVRLREVE